MAVGSHSRSAFNAAAMYAYAERKVINAGAGGRSRSSTINQIKGWKREIKLAPVEKSGSTVVLASSSRSRPLRGDREREREREREKWRAWLICISEEPRVGHRPGRGVTEAGLFASLSGSWPAGKDTRGASLSNDRSNFDDGRRLNGAREFCSRREGGLFEGIDSTNVEQMEEILSMNFRWRVRIIEIDWSTRPQVEEDIIDIFLSSNKLESMEFVRGL